MKRIFAAFFLSIFLSEKPLAADPVEVLPTSGAVIIESKSCDAVEAWSTQFIGAKCAKKVSSGWLSKKCQFNISNCLPNVFRELHGVKAQINGLNSYNASLFAVGIDPALRYTPREEFDFYLRSPLCRKLKPEETREPKDIIVVQDAEGDTISAASFVTENIVFAKNGTEPHSLYLAQTTEIFRTKYQVGEPNRLEYFRCEALETYIKHQAPELSAEVKMHQQISQIELEIATALPIKVSLTSQQVVGLQENLKTVIQLWKSEKSVKKPAPSAEKTFLLEAVKQRLEGISAHLKENSKSVSETEVALKKPLIELIETSVEDSKPLK